MDFLICQGCGYKGKVVNQTNAHRRNCPKFQAYVASFTKPSLIEEVKDKGLAATAKHYGVSDSLIDKIVKKIKKKMAVEAMPVVKKSIPVEATNEQVIEALSFIVADRLRLKKLVLELQEELKNVGEESKELRDKLMKKITFDLEMEHQSLLKESN